MKVMHRPLTMWLLATVASASVQAVSNDAGGPVIVVVLHNYAEIARRILEHAALEITRDYKELGIDVRWMTPPVELDRPGDSANETPVATLHVRMFERDIRDRVSNGVIGIDAPEPAGGLVTVAHVLYQPLDDESTSAFALAYVIARLMANIAMTLDGSRPSTIIRGGPTEAHRLQRGESPFTSEEADRIQAGLRAGRR